MKYLNCFYLHATSIELTKILCHPQRQIKVDFLNLCNETRYLHRLTLVLLTDASSCNQPNCSIGWFTEWKYWLNNIVSKSDGYNSLSRWFNNEQGRP